MKKKILAIVMSVCLLIAACSLLGACDDGKKPVVVTPVSIEGAVDLVAKVNAVDFDFGKGVIVKMSDGTTSKPTIDTSKVKLDTVGEYDVKYTYETLSVTKKIKMYDMPTFKKGEASLANNSSVNVSYVKANADKTFAADITAVDSFNVALTVAVSAESQKFVGEYGTFVVKFSATDAAGNKADYTINANVAADETAPTASNFTYDLADMFGFVTTDIKTATDFTILNGTTPLTMDQFETTDTGVKISGEYLSTLATGATLRLQTVNGYADFVATIESVKPINMSINNMTGWSFLAGTEAKVLHLATRSGYQSFDISYELVTKGADDSASFKVSVISGENSGLKFTKADDSYLEPNNYTIKIIAKNGTEIKATKTADLYVYSESDYYKHIANGECEQNIDKFSINGNIPLEFIELDTIKYGVGGAYRLTDNTNINTWDKRLQFIPSLYAGKLQLNTYNKLTFDFYLESGNPSFPFYIIAGGYKPFGITEKATGDNVAKENVESGKWYTFTCDMTYATAPNTELVLCFANEASGVGEKYIALIRNFVFEGDRVMVTPVSIDGAVDLVAKVNAVDFDFGAGVTVKMSDGTTRTPNIDTSKVKLDTAGEYDVKYTYETLSVTKKIKVYGMPTFKKGDVSLANNSGINVSYLKANADKTFAADITAVDSFNVALTVAISAESQKFVGEYGTFAVKFSATDAAGNKADYTINANVAADETAPTASNFTYDLADMFGFVTTDIKTATEFTILNGTTPLTMDQFETTATGVKISGAYLSTLATGATLRLQTINGYADFVATIENVKPINMSINNMTGWSFLAGTEAKVPHLATRSGYQSFDISYELVTKGANDSASFKVLMLADGLKFTKADGSYLDPNNYTIRIIAKNGTEIKATKTADLYVYSESDYYKHIANGECEQSIGKFSINGNIPLEFIELDTIKYGVGGAYRLTDNTNLSTWDKKLQFLPGLYAGKLQLNTYNKLTFDFYLESGNPSFPFYVIAGGYKQFGITEKATGISVTKEKVVSGKWYTFTCDMIYATAPNTELALCFANEASGVGEKYIALLRNFVFDNDQTNFADGSSSTQLERFHPNNNNDVSVKSVDKTTYGVDSVIEYKSRAGDTDGAKLGINEALLGADKKIRTSSFSKLTFDMWIQSDAIPKQMSFLIVPSVGTWSMPSMFNAPHSIIESGTTNRLTEISQLAKGKWYTITCDIFAQADLNSLAFCFVANGNENVTLYLKDFKFTLIDLTNFADGSSSTKLERFHPNNNNDVSVKSVDKTTYGVDSVIEYKSRAGDTDGAKLGINEAILGSNKNLKTNIYSKLTFDMWIVSDAMPKVMCFGITPTGSGWTMPSMFSGAHSVVEKATSAKVAVATDLAKGKWYTITCVLPEVDVTALQFLFVEKGSDNVTLYLKDFIFTPKA